MDSTSRSAQERDTGKRPTRRPYYTVTDFKFDAAILTQLASDMDLGAYEELQECLTQDVADRAFDTLRGAPSANRWELRKQAFECLASRPIFMSGVPHFQTFIERFMRGPLRDLPRPRDSPSQQTSLQASRDPVGTSLGTSLGGPKCSPPKTRLALPPIEQAAAAPVEESRRSDSERDSCQEPAEPAPVPEISDEAAGECSPAAAAGFPTPSISDAGVKKHPHAGPKVKLADVLRWAPDWPSDTSEDFGKHLRAGPHFRLFNGLRYHADVEHIQRLYIPNLTWEVEPATALEQDVPALVRACH